MSGPGLGAKVSGFSALTRHSMAWPRGFSPLRDRQLLARRHLRSELHQVDAGHHLGHRVLHLDAGVHLHEVEAAVAVEQELDGARRSRSRPPRRAPPPRLPIFCAQLRGQGGRRGLLDQLLVPALDRALALAQVDHLAVLVAEDLELDVPRLDEVLLQVDRAVAEGLLGLLAGGGELAGELLLGVRRSRMPRPPPPAAALRITG